MSPLRIAYVINSLEGGGAASPVPAILSVLRDQGADVRLLALTRRNGKALPAIEEAGIETRIRPGGEKDHWAAVRWLLDQARAFGATHLWTSLTRATLLGQVVGARLGIPVISWQHNAFLKPWNERLLRWRAGASGLWVADSRQVADLTMARLQVPPERLVTWPIFFADPAAPRARPWQPGETLHLGSLGRLHVAKGYDVLIDALALLRREGFAPPAPFRVTITGEGDQLGVLAARRDRAGLDNLAFAGFTADPQGFLAGCHVYVQPSRREGFCIAAHQAMQAGLPPIVSATGEMQHTVSDGRDGRVVPVGDAEALAAALRDILSRPDRIASMGENARVEVLQRFSRERFAAIGADIVERLKARVEPTR